MKTNDDNDIPIQISRLKTCRKLFTCNRYWFAVQLKEMADELNYPGEAFLCKFFKKHTGMTPSHYRNTSR